MSNTSKQAIWIKKFFNELQALDCIDSLSILSDNIFNIKMTKNNKFHGQTKHIDIQHHLIRELVEENKIFADYINIKNMLADNFTKTLAKPKFENY